MKSWRDLCRPVIAGVIEKVGMEDKGALKRALFDAYPFGKREHFPYKVWLDEIKRQTGKNAKPIREQTEKLF